jgi:hypothetical protein
VAVAVATFLKRLTVTITGGGTRIAQTLMILINRRTSTERINRR